MFIYIICPVRNQTSSQGLNIETYVRELEKENSVFYPKRDAPKLGDKVRDKVTGFEGIAVAKTDWLNGCARYGVQSQVLKDGVPTEAQWFDAPQLERVEQDVVSTGPRDTGGPIPTPRRSADPRR